MLVKGVLLSVLAQEFVVLAKFMVARYTAKAKEENDV